MNFIFISPQFPENYYLFCRGLKRNGVTVLGIGDTPYKLLKEDVRENLTEYYYVPSLENYDEKYRAVAYFISKYGRIDYIESNNEYWLSSDAFLRSDFNIRSGPGAEDILCFQSKTAMKNRYAAAGVSTARYILPGELEDAIAFVQEVGYPIIAKPDIGVGAEKTYKIRNIRELTEFFREYDGAIPYILEEYIEGDLVSLDGVCNSHGAIVIPTHHVFPTPILDIVSSKGDCFYYTNREIPLDLYNAGQSVLKAFGARSRFFHLEFFRLKKDREGLGKQGELIGLEVNMRAPGGYTPDMIDYAYSTDIYQAWADVMVFDENRTYIPDLKRYCAFFGRRAGTAYRHTHSDVLVAYSANLKLCDAMPRVLSGAMGDYFYIATFDTVEQMLNFRDFLAEREYYGSGKK